MTKPNGRLSETCKRCGSKELTMQCVVNGLQVPLCAKCTEGWWNKRYEVLGEAFEAYLRSENSPQGLDTTTVARRKGRP